VSVPQLMEREAAPYAGRSGRAAQVRAHRRSTSVARVSDR
jgi:hypothetical protein